MTKMKEYSRAYTEEALNMALSRIKIMQCQKCGHPTQDGYCCPHCDSGAPTIPGQEESMIEV